jgi:hypothetical protein
MTQAVAGHGATVAMELDPTGARGTFTVIAELNGDITFPELSRGETEVTPHQDHIDSWVLGILRRGPLTLAVNYIFDDQTHDHLTGLISAIKDNEVRGFRIRGPGGSANTDEWIASGQVQLVGPITNPVREGARTAAVSIRLSGPMKIDGVSFGT